MIDIIFLLKKKRRFVFYIPPSLFSATYLSLPLPTTTYHYLPLHTCNYIFVISYHYRSISSRISTCQFLPLSTCHCLPISTCTIYLYLPLFPPANVLFDRENEKILNIIFPEPWHIRSGYQIIPKIIFSILFWLQITPRK